MIDWSANEGKTPDHLDGNIKFSNVEFAYPTRIDIQVPVCCMSCITVNCNKFH